VLKHFVEKDLDEAIHALGGLDREFAGKTIILTGAAGFLGRYFIGLFRKLNHSLHTPARVLALDNFIASNGDDFGGLEDPHIQFIKHDAATDLPVTIKPDFIIHAAGIASPFYYRKYPLETLDVAVIGTRKMLELAKIHGARMLYFSSSEIYGDPDAANVPTRESYRGHVASIGPRACYDESKRLGETLCHIYCTEFGTQANIVRPFNVYGPGMKENDYRVLPNFASRIAAGRPVRVYQDGKQTRTFCYISDALNGFVRVLLNGRGGEAYNIGNPNPEVSMVQLYEHVQSVLPQPLEMEFIGYPDSYPADEPRRRCPDIFRASEELGYKPQVKLSDGLRRFFDWTRVHYRGVGQE